MIACWVFLADSLLFSKPGLNSSVYQLAIFSFFSVTQSLIDSLTSLNLSAAGLASSLKGVTIALFMNVAIASVISPEVISLPSPANKL